MKLNITDAETERTIEISRSGDCVSAAIDGRSYDLEVSQPESNVYLLRHDGRIFEITVDRHDSGVAAALRSHRFEYSVSDPRKLRSAGSDGASAQGSVQIKTAMPGKIVRILAEGGRSVAKGDGLLVVEAMKMQNEIKAPKDGVVAEIRVTEGATVAAGDVLAVIE